MTAGVAGNLPIGPSLTFVSPVAGVTGTATVGAGGLLNGAEAEADVDLRSRLLARIRQPAQGGAASDYLTWALEVSGISRAWVYPQELGAGTVTVRVVSDAAVGGLIPGAAKIAEVQAWINARRPTCGHHGRGDSDQRKQQRCGDNRDRVEGADAVQLTSEHCPEGHGECQANGTTNRDGTNRVAKHQAQNRCGWSAQRRPDAQLARTLRHVERCHAENADRGEQQRNSAKQSGERSAQLRGKSALSIPQSLAMQGDAKLIARTSNPSSPFRPTVIATAATCNRDIGRGPSGSTLTNA